MSALDELSQALTTVSAAIAPSVVGIGSRLRGSGVVTADGQVLTNAHNVRGDEVTVTFADGRTATGTVAGIDVDGDLAVIAVDTGGAPALAWADDGAAGRLGSVVFGAAATAGGGARSRSGPSAASSDRSGVPAAGASAAASSTPRRWRRARRAGRSSTLDGRLVGLNTNRIGEGFYLALPADAALRPASRPSAAASRSAGRGSGSPSRRAASPATSAVRSACPDRDGVLVRAVEDDGPAGEGRDPRRRPDRRDRRQPVTEPDQLQELIASTPMPFEVKVVRGTDERTVSVGGGASARARRRSGMVAEPIGPRPLAAGRRSDEDELLDAYSAAVSTAAERLIPSVASLRVRSSTGWGGGAGPRSRSRPTATS